jgi:hypothetical protein
LSYLTAEIPSLVLTEGRKWFTLSYFTAGTMPGHTSYNGLRLKWTLKQSIKCSQATLIALNIWSHFSGTENRYVHTASALISRESNGSAGITAMFAIQHTALRLAQYFMGLDFRFKSGSWESSKS